MRHFFGQHKGMTAFVVVTVLLGGGLLAAGEYFYRVAFVPATKSFLNNSRTKKQQADRDWLQRTRQETWHEAAVGHPDWRLTAVYVPAERATKRTVVVAHGYMNTKEDMASYIRLFHDAGYNVLAPDDRAHGASDGDAIGYGWADRKDYLRWLNELLRRKGQDQQVALYGLSMGGATVMYLSGEKLPKRVYAIIEDCGYSSVDGVISHQAKSQYGLPRWPLVPLVLRIAQWHTGVDYKNANALAALRRNHLPTLFIHGTKDDFVPAAMLKDNYAASAGEKAIWRVPDAGHAQSLGKHPDEYARRVREFLNAHWPQ